MHIPTFSVICRLVQRTGLIFGFMKFSEAGVRVYFNHFLGSFKRHMQEKWCLQLNEYLGQVKLCIRVREA